MDKQSHRLGTAAVQSALLASSTLWLLQVTLPDVMLALRSPWSKPRTNPLPSPPALVTTSTRAWMRPARHLSLYIFVNANGCIFMHCSQHLYAPATAVDLRQILRRTKPMSAKGLGL